MARRRYQHGWVKRVNDSWYGYWREDVIVNGQITRPVRCVVLGMYPQVPTKRMALRLLAPYTDKVNASSYRPVLAVTFASFVAEWQDKVLVMLKPSSQAAVKSHLKNWLQAEFGTMLLTEIGQQSVQSFVSQMSGKVSRKTLTNVLATLNSILSAARRWGYQTGEFSVKYLTLPSLKPREQARVLTPDEFRRILDVAEEPFRTMYAIAGFAMLRAGEIVGLRWEDVDFEQGTISIRQSGWYGQIVVPKTQHSTATVPLTGALRVYLTSFRGWSHAQFDGRSPSGESADAADGLTTERMSHRRGQQGLLFPRADDHSRPITANWVVQKKLKPLLKLLGIAPCGFHAFRHAGATLLADAGVPVKVIQGLLRHADSRTTMNVYAHLVEQSQRDAADKLSSLLLTRTKEQAHVN